MITLIILGILSYMYGAVVFYKTVVKDAEWNILEVKQNIIQYIFSGLFFIYTIFGILAVIIVGMKYLFDLIVKYLP